jgi:hypothetical protein
MASEAHVAPDDDEELVSGIGGGPGRPGAVALPPDDEHEARTPAERVAMPNTAIARFRRGNRRRSGRRAVAEVTSWRNVALDW